MWNLQDMGDCEESHPSDSDVTRVPGLADAFDFFDEFRAVDFERSRSLCPARVVVIGHVERVSQKANVCGLQCLESLKEKKKED